MVGQGQDANGECHLLEILTDEELAHPKKIPWDDKSFKMVKDEFQRWWDGYETWPEKRKRAYWKSRADYLESIGITPDNVVEFLEAWIAHGQYMDVIFAGGL